MNWEKIFLPGTQIGATEEVCLQPTGQHRLSAASGGVAMHQQVHEQHGSIEEAAAHAVRICSESQQDVKDKHSTLIFTRCSFP